jgi:hypothetical protein
VKSSEGARRSTRLRLQPLRKPKTSPKKKPVKLQTKMPKKPATAFFFFLDDFRKQYQEENPDVKSMREVVEYYFVGFVCQSKTWWLLCSL